MTDFEAPQRPPVNEVATPRHDNPLPYLADVSRVVSQRFEVVSKHSEVLKKLLADPRVNYRGLLEHELQVDQTDDVIAALEAIYRMRVLPGYSPDLIAPWEIPEHVLNDYLTARTLVDVNPLSTDFLGQPERYAIGYMGKVLGALSDLTYAQQNGAPERIAQLQAVQIIPLIERTKDYECALYDGPNTQRSWFGRANALNNYATDVCNMIANPGKMKVTEGELLRAGYDLSTWYRSDIHAAEGQVLLKRVIDPKSPNNTFSIAGSRKPLASIGAIDNPVNLLPDVVRYRFTTDDPTAYNTLALRLGDIARRATPPLPAHVKCFEYDGKVVKTTIHREEDMLNLAQWITKYFSETPPGYLRDANAQIVIPGTDGKPVEIQLNFGRKAPMRWLAHRAYRFGGDFEAAGIDPAKLPRP